MSRYQVTTVVEYTFEVEADSDYAAEQHGWNYEDYPFSGEVQDISVYEYPEDEE